MAPLVERWEQLEAFMETGGATVEWILFWVTLAMWTLIIERFWFMWFVYPGERTRVLSLWKARPEHGSWYAHQIRDLWIAQVQEQLKRSIGLIRSLVSVCPLLGLLGTVMGMLEVFDVMARSGSGNLRAMAAGVSSAMISTMSGLVAALSGLYFAERLRRRAADEARRMEDLLTTS